MGRGCHFLPNALWKVSDMRVVVFGFVSNVNARFKETVWERAITAKVFHRPYSC